MRFESSFLQTPIEQISSPQEETNVDIENGEKYIDLKPGILIFGAPFNSDPNLTGQAIDDSGMGQEIPRGALSVATLLGRRGFPAEVVPMDAFLNREFISNQAEIALIRQENFSESDSDETNDLQNGVAKEAFFITKMRETVHKLIEVKNPRVVAFSYMFSPTEGSILAMARYVKENFPDKLVVIGGNAASFDEASREQLLDPSKSGADVIVNYEGEWTMLDIMEAVADLEQKKEKNQPGAADESEEGKPKINLVSIEGISFWKNGKVFSTERRERGNPAEITALNYDRVVLPDGVDIGDFNHYVLFARGCLGRCAFCTSKNMYKRFTTEIGLQSFAEELEYVAAAVNKREGREKTIGILDDDIFMEPWLDLEGNITNDKNLAVERKTVFEIIAPILKDIHKRYPDISFIAQTRVGHFRSHSDPIDPGYEQGYRINTALFQPDELLREAKECGIDLVLLGIESGSQKILDASLKDTRTEWVERACTSFKKAGIGVGAFWIIGLPGASRDEELKSLEFLKHLVKNELIDDLEAHVFVPLPGTSALEEAQKKSGKSSLRLDTGPRQPNHALFDGETTYVHIDENGEVVLSKEEIREIFRQTWELVEILRNRKREKNQAKLIEQ